MSTGQYYYHSCLVVYLWLPATGYCMTLCCIRGVLLPQLPMVTFGYQHYQVFQDCMQYCGVVTSVTWWLPCVTSITRYCMTLCCIREVWLPQLPNGYLWLPLVASVTRYCRTLGCIHGVLVNTVTTVTCV